MFVTLTMSLFLLVDYNVKTPSSELKLLTTCYDASDNSVNKVANLN